MATSASTAGTPQPVAADSTAPVDSTNLAELAFWRRPVAERDAVFATLRTRDRPAFFTGKPRADGSRAAFHALVRHADIVEASRHPEVFSSATGATPETPPQYAAYFGSMINLDDPRHARLRRIVARTFTPRRIRHIDDLIQATVTDAVDHLAATGPCDFAVEVAAHIPLRVICDLTGVPEDRRDEVLTCSNRLLGGFDPEYSATMSEAANGLVAAALHLHGMAAGLAADRRDHPGEDLVSALATANVDGERLTPDEIGSFFLLILVAGNETTRHALTQGLALLSAHPDQRARWQADPDRHTATAVEEIVRLSSPVNYMRRHLTRDHPGLGLRAGDEVRLFYRSANRDAAVFDRPDAFDVTRSPNPHVGYGAPGPHLCLGTHLARQEIAVTFRQLFDRLPRLRTTGEPEALLSSFINGVKHLPCTPN